MEPRALALEHDIGVLNPLTQNSTTVVNTLKVGSLSHSTSKRITSRGKSKDGTVRNTSVLLRLPASFNRSTPDPRRRLAQHNGAKKGGAERTRRENLRPWEMTCIVSGFTSSVAALQFEWALQHPNLTSKIEDSQRISKSVLKKSSSGRTRILTPRMDMKVVMANLHLLLRVPAFARWPLSVRFFVEDLYAWWEAYCNTKCGPLKAVEVELDLRKSERSKSLLPPPGRRTGGKTKQFAPTGEGGLQGLDITNSHLDRHMQKARDLLRDKDIKCGVCAGGFAHDGEAPAVVCPHAFCNHVAHLRCLSQVFLQTDVKYAVLPTEGVCPECKKSTKWVDLVKELSSRTRRKPEAPRKKGVSAVGMVRGEDEEDGEEDGEEEEEEAEMELVPSDNELELYDIVDHIGDSDSPLSVADSDSGASDRSRGSAGKSKRKRSRSGDQGKVVNA